MFRYLSKTLVILVAGILIGGAPVLAGDRFVDNGDGSGSFGWRPQTGDGLNSPYAVSFTAVDRADATLSDSRSITIRVEAPGSQPAVFRQDGGTQKIVSIEAEHHITKYGSSSSFCQV